MQKNKAVSRLGRGLFFYKIVVFSMMRDSRIASNMVHRIVLPFAAAICLSACGSADDQQGLTSTEERELDEAAAALDEAQAEYEAALQQPPAETDREEP